MTYIYGVHSSVSKPRLLKRKEAEELVHHSPNCFHSALAPGPDLRRYKIKNRHFKPLKMPCKPQMKIRAVGENRSIRPVFLSESHQFSVFAVNPREVTHYFG
jgi:hypothetical protein